MTREEIRSMVKQGNGTLDFELYSEAFGSIVLQGIFKPTINWTTFEKESDIDKLVTDYITDCINSFINLDSSLFVDKLKDDIFRLFNICIENTSYGQVPDDLVKKFGEIEANRIFFNGQNRDSVYSNCRFHSVLYDNDTKPQLGFSIFIEVDWDQHGMSIFFVDGNYDTIE